VPDGRFDSALRESVAEALEEMFFVTDLGEAEPGASSAGPELLARVDFVGNPSGWLTLRADVESARSLAADFLGEDLEAVDDRQTSDVLGELANIVCGAVLTRTESSCIFHLSSPLVASPQQSAPPEAASADGSESAEYVVTLANGPLTVFLKTEVSECPPGEKFAS
jgi:CheY-specific phosphatase CheX